jgi:hypothetical protein
MYDDELKEYVYPPLPPRGQSLMPEPAQPPPPSPLAAPKFSTPAQSPSPSGAYATPTTVIGLNKLIPKSAPVLDTSKPAVVKKSARINPDAIPVLALAVGLVTLLMITSFTVSFSGIYTVSEWTGLPGFLQWLPAIFIDSAILAYTISLVVFKARGESTWRTLVGLSAFAGISIVANIAHTLSYWNGTLVDYRAWIGVIITAAAPIAVLLASEEITRLAFENPETKS